MDEKLKNILKKIENDYKYFMHRGLKSEVNDCEYDVEFMGNSGNIELKIKFNKKEKEKEYIECPINFRSLFGTLGLEFGNKQVLCYDDTFRIWKVTTIMPTFKTKTKISKTPTPQDKLEVGKWYYCTHMNIDDDRDHKPIEQFHLYLGENEYIWIDGDDNSLLISEAHYKHWHEVVEDEY